MDRDFYKKSMEAAGGMMIQQGLRLVEQGNELLARTRYQTVTVLTRWFNEEILAPFFLEHYAWADEIVILLDEETTDASAGIAGRHRKARVVPYRNPRGFNAADVTDRVNRAAAEIATDWIVSVDPDEFVWAPGFADVRETLAEADGNLVYVDFWQVYRHRTEMDLDPSLKAVWLRRHGDPNRTKGTNALYRKPVIVRAGLGIRWGVGLHAYEPNDRIVVSSTRFDGAHWVMADPDLAVRRRLRGRRENVSEENLRMGWSCNNFDVTEEEIRAECARHLDDPQLF